MFDKHKIFLGDDVNKIKQTIAYTLQKIPLIADYTEALQDAVLMTVKALYAAPRISPLADVNIENIAKFMVALCKTSQDVSINNIFNFGVIFVWLCYVYSNLNTFSNQVNILMYLNIMNNVCFSFSTANENFVKYKYLFSIF